MGACIKGNSQLKSKYVFYIQATKIIMRKKSRLFIFDMNFFFQTVPRLMVFYTIVFWVFFQTHNHRDDFLKSCLDLYVQEVEILCEVQGDLHPNTVRSREDVIIILQNLGRDADAKVYQAQQPKEHAAL